MNINMKRTTLNDELIRLWNKCKEETKEQRLIDTSLCDDGEIRYFKLSFDNFINWLENRK